ncbi:MULTISPECIES: helix-turn-helix transcriptional regulator [unclassified Bradyrhizobium]
MATTSSDVPLRRTIRRQQLREMVPLADSTIYEMEQRGEFPRRFSPVAPHREHAAAAASPAAVIATLSRTHQPPVKKRARLADGEAGPGNGWRPTKPSGRPGSPPA